jgi:hypothetical protein
LPIEENNNIRFGTYRQGKAIGSLLTVAREAGNAVPQLKIGGVLGGNAVAAPAEESVFKGGEVKQGLSHRLGCELEFPRAFRRAVFQGPQEKEGPLTVIIRHEIPVIHRVTGSPGSGPVRRRCFFSLL